MFGSTLIHYISQGVDHGLFQWHAFRRAYRELERWFRQGVIDLSISCDSNSWVVCQLEIAVLAHVEGITFSERELRGLRALETSEGFWSLNPAADFPWSSIRPTASNDDDTEYMARYACMSRIDIHHLTQDGDRLSGGAPRLLAPQIDALRRSLVTPRTMAIVGRNEDSTCVLSRALGRQFGAGSLLTVDITYTGGG